MSGVHQAVFTALWTLMRNDPVLQAEFSPDWPGPLARPPADTEWPYLFHKLETAESFDNATRGGTYRVEIWDYGTSLNRTWRIRARLMHLLDLSLRHIPNQGALRLWFSSETSMPNEDTNVMTHALVFTVRHARAGEIAGIIQER